MFHARGITSEEDKLYRQTAEDISLYSLFEKFARLSIATPSTLQ
jgi:hypothetical protein